MFSYLYLVVIDFSSLLHKMFFYNLLLFQKVDLVNHLNKRLMHYNLQTALGIDFHGWLA
jgi:hypothetical protein